MQVKAAGGGESRERLSVEAIVGCGMWIARIVSMVVGNDNSSCHRNQNRISKTGAAHDLYFIAGTTQPAVRYSRRRVGMYDVAALKSRSITRRCGNR